MLAGLTLTPVWNTWHIAPQLVVLVGADWIRY